MDGIGWFTNGARSAARMVCLALLAALAACASKPHHGVAGLPELPADLAKTLTKGDAAPVLTTRDIDATRPIEKIRAAESNLAPARSCTDIWDGYVVYPMTVCYPPTAEFETVALERLAARNARAQGSIVAPAYFKLSEHPLVSIRRPWFCTVRGGPWYAHVEGKQICNTNPNVRQFTAEILGAPQSVVVTWSGALEDVPAPLQLPGLTLTKQVCVCCSGVTCPDGSCKPNANQCGGGGSPAVK